MNKMFFRVSEFGEIQNSKIINKKSIIAFILFLLFLTISNNSFSQTISGTGSAATTCGNCTPTGWVDSGGTPDIANRTNTGGQGSAGGNATWVNPLPLPPTGDLTWISIRDIGDGTVITGSEESVRTTMGGLVAGKVYRLNIYTLTSLSNANGNDPTNSYYSGTYMDEFEFEVEGNGRQPIRNISREVWGTKSVIFIGDPTSGNMDLAFFPKTNATLVGFPYPGLESVQIAIELNDLEELDSDGDGIPDTDDVDDDNDGILDTVENTVGGTTYVPLGDEDGDKLPNYLDVRDDGTGDGSTTNYTDINNDGIADIFDFDLDGIPNHLDLDADNDGIPDNIEAQTTNGYIAPSGAPGAGFTDVNNNGLDDNYETAQGGTNITPVNSDSAIVTDNPDYLDLDSDQDGVSDTTEANLILIGTVGKNGLDNTYDNGDDYKDVNGIFDNTQTDNFPDDGANANLGLPNDVNWRDTSVTGFVDTDGDGIPNFTDIDNDNDGIIDTDEGFVACVTYDGSLFSEANTGGGGAINGINIQGEPDNIFAEIDFNNDVLVYDLGQEYPAGTKYQLVWRRKPGEAGTAIPIINESVSGASGFINNPVVPQSSQDAIFQTDVVVSNSSFRYVQITKQATPSTTDFQIDAIGIVEITDCATGTDPDGDGIPNYLDLDSDNDGIPDNIEAQATASYIAPSGAPGAGFTDTNNNGLDDNYETAQGGSDISPVNTDSPADTIPDFLDTDSDNDGTSDRLEANLTLNGVYGINGLDSNIESADNYIDVNGTFDTTPFNDFPDTPSGGEIDWRDATAVFSDNDGDGVPDSVDLDDDNDGILDTEECEPSVDPFNFNLDVGNLTFTNSGLAGDVGDIAVYSNVGTYQGIPIDLKITVIANSDPTNMAINISGFTFGSDLYPIHLEGTNVATTPYANVNFEFLQSGTSFPIEVPASIVFKDIDFLTPTPGESVEFSKSDISEYKISITPSTNISVSEETTSYTGASGDFLRFLSSGTDSGLANESLWFGVQLRKASVYNINFLKRDFDTGYNFGSVTFTNTPTTVTLPNCSNDTDGDGIPNYLDLDSDNDGIPDNIEAQSTTGYVAPDGIVDANGVDTAYTGGLLPEDTDGDNTQDYLDLDSDDDGLLDNTEAGLTLTGVYGNNGLDNAYDNGDNYLDVNGSFDNTQTDNFPDEDGDVLSSGDVDYRDDTFTTDYDDDGISDELDLDDDNDGIVDAIELGAGSCTLVDPTSGELNWSTQYATDNDPILVNPVITDSNVTMTLSRSSNVSSESTYTVNSTINPNSYNLNQGASSNALSRHKVTFDTPVYGVNFTIYDVNQDVATIATDKVQVILTKQDGSTYNLVATNYTLGATNSFTGLNTFQGTTTGTSNIIINSIPEWITQIQIVYENEGTGSLTDQQDIAIGNIGFCTPIDSDGDGVFDFRDLDADNDGIPDNIEAQSTSGYIAPTGNYSISGIDLAYDTGLTPINTDGTGNADYLDLDSDDDGVNDILESGLTTLSNDGSRVTGAVGNNGLLDTLDDNGTGDTDGDGLGEGTGDNYKDVNGTFDDTQNDNFTDGDSDVNIGGDLDYRDTVVGVDSDGDGIANNIDIDDDNDGIPDVNEDSQIISFVTTPEAYWPLDGNTDDAINSNDERANGAAPSYSTNAIQGTNSADFNGTTNTIRYSQDSNGFMEGNYSQISFSAWIKPDDVSGQRIIYEEGGGTNGVTLWIDNGVLTFSTRNGGAVSQRNITHPTSLTVDGEWHHVAATFSNGILTVYLDGVPSSIDVSSDYTTIPNHGSDGGLGGPIDGATSGNISGFYDGLMDAVRYSNTTTFSSADVLTEATKINNSDFDGDGIINSLDIDADNDGIPDNVEAQTTLGYVTPSGVDTDNDGLDDAYDTDCTPCGGITGVDLSVTNNNDGTDNPDFVDLDSDNDGTPDIQENGDSDNSVSGTDSDNDGLDDNFEGADVNDGYDVNDEINTPSTDLPDTDSDVNDGGNVDYRDATNDPVTVGSDDNILWLRADIDVTGTTAVTAWADQTASNFTATATNSPAKVDGGLNFNPTIDFDGTNDFMQITGGILGNNTTYDNIWVYAVTKANANEYFYTLSQGTGDTRFYFLTPDNAASSQIAFNFGAAAFIGTPWGANTGEFNLWNAGSSTGTATPSATNKSLYRNGFEIATDNLASQLISNNTQNFFIGSFDGTQRFTNGEIAEIMVFDAVPSAVKQQQIQSYLAIKYGITLSNDTDADTNINEVVSGSINEGDYILNDLTTKVWDSETEYHNDVAGIGRDDAMVLNQKQSKSINSDAIITIGLDAIATTNQTNGNTFTTNKDFIMWGNNNGSLASGDVTETELICAPEKTLSRTWKVVERGTVGSVQIAANKTIIDNGLTTPNTVKVFKVADDASFTTNVEYIPVTSETINSEVVYTVDYDFEGVKYFTYSEINGIFWNGDAGVSGSWIGGNSTLTGVNLNGPSRNAADRDKVMVIDAQTSLTNAVLPEDARVECVWIKENSKLIIPDNMYLEFDEDFILDGEMRLVGDGQLVQTHVGLSNVEGTGKLY
ncbi:hypothetical protein FDT66_13900, partial [Polaribacter aestuariivivens]